MFKNIHIYTHNWIRLQSDLHVSNKGIEHLVSIFILILIKQVQVQSFHLGYQLEWYQIAKYFFK